MAVKNLVKQDSRWWKFLSIRGSVWIVDAFTSEIPLVAEHIIFRFAAQNLTRNSLCHIRKLTISFSYLMELLPAFKNLLSAFTGLDDLTIVDLSVDSTIVSFFIFFLLT